jgi:hypothetical protein
MRKLACIGALAVLAGFAQDRPWTPSKVSHARDAVYLTIDAPGAKATFPTGISADGRIVGKYLTVASESGLPFSYEPGIGFLLEKDRFRDIVFPYRGVYLCIATKINPQGEVVGWYVKTPDGAAGSESSFLLRRGDYSPIRFQDSAGAFQELVTDAAGINARGDMAGQVGGIAAGSTEVSYHGWIYRQGQYRLFDPPGSVMTYVSDINARGEVIGSYFLAWDGTASGFLRSASGDYKTFGPPGAAWHVPAGINDRGDIVGTWAATAGASTYLGYLLRKGDSVFTPIEFPGAALTYPFGLNDAGLIVGSYKDAGDGLWHGFLRIPR